MSDLRVRVPLSGRQVRLAQLSDEVGAPLTASDTEIVVADPDSTLTVEDLQAALDAHIPAPVVDADAAFRAAVSAATTIAQLRDALLGNAGPGAEPRRSPRETT